MRRSRLAGFILLAAALVLGSTRAGAEPRVFVTNEKFRRRDRDRRGDPSRRRDDPSRQASARRRGEPDGRRVYVTNSNSDSLSVIDAKTLAVLSTVPAGIDPEGLTVNRAGTALYVVNENDSR